MITSAYANLLLRPDLGRRPYRLRCRFRIEPRPRKDYLDKAKVRAAEMFVADMHKQGWEYVDRYGFTMKGPFVHIEPMTIRRPPRLTSRQMLEGGLMQGNRFRASVETIALPMPTLQESEYWEFELAGVFTHSTILTELAD